MVKTTSFVILAISCCVFLAAANSYAQGSVYIWHSNTFFSGFGKCSAVFDFDSQAQHIQKLEITIEASNKEQKPIDYILAVPEFGKSMSDRYSSSLAEGEVFCDENTSINVKKASGIIEGKNQNLLQEHLLVWRKPTPFKININQ